MKQRFLEAGEIVSTHGVRGEVKILSWGDTPEFLCAFDTVYLDGKPLRLLGARLMDVPWLYRGDGSSASLL